MTKERLVVFTDSQLRRDFKSAVALSGTNMSALVEAFMRSYITPEGKAALEPYLESRQEQGPVA